jgi:predicted  nucleic acid-binding Zn-ribbon protein
MFPSSSVPEQILGDVDVTVMAYAQWLSEMKQRSTSMQYQQQAELDLMRDAINANNGELIDFKRHSSTIQQQLQGQVSELREKVSDLFSEMQNVSRQRAELDARSSNEVGGIREELSARQSEIDAVRRSLSEQISQLASAVSQVDSKIQCTDTEVGNMRKALGSSHEQTIGKFGEMDKAMSLFHQSVNGIRTELQETKQDWKRGQDLLGQAISTLSQDLADFQKHASTVMNKLQSDVYLLEETGRDERERIARVEAQLSGVQQNLYSTANELILMKSENAERENATTSPKGGLSSPRPTSRTPGGRRSLGPRDGNPAQAMPAAEPPNISEQVPLGSSEALASATQLGQRRGASPLPTGAETPSAQRLPNSYPGPPAQSGGRVPVQVVPAPAGQPMARTGSQAAVVPVTVQTREMPQPGMPMVAGVGMVPGQPLPSARCSLALSPRPTAARSCGPRAQRRRGQGFG